MQHNEPAGQLWCIRKKCLWEEKRTFVGWVDKSMILVAPFIHAAFPNLPDFSGVAKNAPGGTTNQSGWHALHFQ